MSVKKRFLLRINADLYGVLERWAADDLRSINAQIEYLLSESARAAHRWRTPEARQVGKSPPQGHRER
jgi:hypothetical protein